MHQETNAYIKNKNKQTNKKTKNQKTTTKKTQHRLKMKR